MSEELTNMDVWKDRVQQDINDIKQRQSQNEEKLNNAVNDIQGLKLSDQLQDKEISSLKETLGEIKDDTNFIRNRMDQDRDEQLKQYKNMGWKIVTAIVVAGALILLGLQ